MGFKQLFIAKLIKGIYHIFLYIYWLFQTDFAIHYIYKFSKLLPLKELDD